MAYDGAGAIFALGARLTKLDADGAPLLGANMCYTTEALISATIGNTYSEPDAIQLNNGQGQVCVSYTPTPVLLNGTLEEFKFCTPDPYVYQWIVGGDVLSTGGVNEVKTLTISGTPTGGSYTLTINGQTTAPIAYNAANSAIQSALLALSSLDTGDVVVTGAGPFTLTFGGVYAGQTAPAMTATASLTGGTSPNATVTVATPGGGGDATGYRAPIVNTDPVPNGIGIELWSKAVLNNALLGGGIHWVLPRARLTPSEGLALGAEDPIQPTFSGTLDSNGNFGGGPVGDITFPTDRIYQYQRVSTIPDLGQGLVTVTG